jgi:hypothetical protein
VRRNWQLPVWILILLLTTAGMTTARLQDIAGHYAASAIAALQARDVVQGSGDDRFEPNAPLTRAQLAKMIVAALDQESDARLLGGYNSRFSDVRRNHWANGYVEALAEMGVTQGYPDGSFQPEATVSRVEITVLLVRAAGLEQQTLGLRQAILPFADADQIGAWARGHVAVAVRQGLVMGLPDGTFRPGAPVSRGDGALMLARLLAIRGALYQLTGTLMNWTLEELTVRDPFGAEHVVPLTQQTVVYRGGNQVLPTQLQVADQVWVMQNARGEATFVEARFRGVRGRLLEVQARTLRYVPDGAAQPLSVVLEPGALFFLNGALSPLQEVSSAQHVYLAMNASTGEVRIVDAVAYHMAGAVVGVNVQEGWLTLLSDEGLKRLDISIETRLYVHGERTDSLGAAAQGDRAMAVLDSSGRVATYLQIEKPGAR